MTKLDKQSLNPFGNDPDEEKPHDDCTVLQKVHHQNLLETQSRCCIWDKIVLSSGSRIAILAIEIIRNHHLRQCQETALIVRPLRTEIEQYSRGSHRNTKASTQGYVKE